MVVFRRMARGCAGGLLVVVVAGAFAAVACDGGAGDAAPSGDGSVGPPHDGAAGAGGEAPSGAAGASAGRAGGAARCVPSGAPGEADEPDPAFVDADCDGVDGSARSAVFASPAGDDAAAGTREAPVRSVSKAIELARADKRSVYLCIGTYDENVVLEGDAPNLYGGYDCADGWSRRGERSVIAPRRGVGLRVRSVGAPLVIDHVAIAAPDGKEPGESSVAVVVTASPSVTFSRGEVTAGDGSPGVEGSPPLGAEPHAPSGQEGESVAFFGGSCNDTKPNCGLNHPSWCAPYAGGFRYVAGTCGVGYAGGRGGSKCPSNSPEQPGGNWDNLVTPLDGRSGAQGKAGGVGPSATRGWGAVTFEGDYVPSNAGGEGTPGTDGKPGEGGDGGKAPYQYQGDIVSHNFRPGGGGGQGGYAGCAGLGGKGGGGGGASIALLAVSSPVRLVATRLRTGRGGPGGGPGAGAPGQSGGLGGPGGLNTGLNGVPLGARGGNGGRGGDGGPGGPGGPGGGGPSIALLIKGAEPSFEQPLVPEVGEGGPGGLALDGGDGAPGLAGDVVRLDENDDLLPAAPDAAAL